MAKFGQSIHRVASTATGRVQDRDLPKILPRHIWPWAIPLQGSGALQHHPKAPSGQKPGDFNAERRKWKILADISGGYSHVLAW